MGRNKIQDSYLPCKYLIVGKPDPNKFIYTVKLAEGGDNRKTVNSVQLKLVP